MIAKVKNIIIDILKTAFSLDGFNLISGEIFEKMM
jgi:hypothetical protein